MVADANGERPTDFVRRLMPLCATLGVEAERVSADEVVLTLDWAAELCTSGGVLHGGALMALADSAGATCAFLSLPEGAGGTATIESKTNFVAGVRSGRVVATARVLHAGRRTILVETELRTGDGRLAGKVTQTQIVL